MEMDKIQLDLDKINGFKLLNVGGVEMVCLPYKSSYMNKFDRKDGTKGLSMRLVLVHLESPRPGRFDGTEDYAFVKQDIKKEVWDTLSEDGKKKLPILGNVTRKISFATAPPVSYAPPVSEFDVPADDDLPF